MNKAVTPQDKNVRPDPSDQALLSRGALQAAQEKGTNDGVQSASDKALVAEGEKQRKEQTPDTTRVGGYASVPVEVEVQRGNPITITDSTATLPVSPADIPSNQHPDGAGGVAGKLDGPTQSVTPAQNQSDVHVAPNKTAADPK